MKDGKGDNGLKGTAKGLPSASGPQAEIACLHLLDFTFSKCVSTGCFITSPNFFCEAVNPRILRGMEKKEIQKPFCVCCSLDKLSAGRRHEQRGSAWFRRILSRSQ